MNARFQVVSGLRSPPNRPTLDLTPAARPSLRGDTFENGGENQTLGNPCRPAMAPPMAPGHRRSYSGGGEASPSPG